MRRLTNVALLVVFLLTGRSSPAAEADLANSATPADQLKLLPGFKAELLYSVPTAEQGSWVSLTSDDKGRLIASDQSGALYRITPPPFGSDERAKVERLKVAMGMAHGLCYAFDSLYCVVNGEVRRNSPLQPDIQLKTGLYRLRDTNGDDTLDEVTYMNNGGILQTVLRDLAA